MSSNSRDPQPIRRPRGVTTRWLAVLGASTLALSWLGPVPSAGAATATTGTTATTTAAAAATPAPTLPVRTAMPTLSGTLQVGATVSVAPGSWTGTAPITFSYLYQVCDAAGASCATAPGLFANGMRPRLLLLAATAGKYLRVKVTATNLAGKVSATTALAGPIAAYPATAAPKVEFVNGLPDAVSWSNRSTFQVQATGTGVTLSCKLDAKAAAACPTTNKVTYGSLAPGSHTVTVTATNANGVATVSHTWQVQALPAPTPCPGCYHPAVGSTWQWQLNPDSGKTSIDTSVVADMYEIDGFVNDAATVATLHSLPGTHTASRGVTCYWSAGTLEVWRADALGYDPMLMGNAYSGFADERWLDIRRISQLAPLLQARMDMCKAKGFDAIEFDNMDSWFADNKTGLNLTQEDATAFVVWLAQQAHLRGMSMALKSVVELVPAVRQHVDFSVVEQCFEFKECTRTMANSDGVFGYDLMIEIGKPVFEAEYKAYSATANVCAQANGFKFATIYKKVALDSYRVSCNG